MAMQHGRRPPILRNRRCRRRWTDADNPLNSPGASTQWGNGARCTMAKIGGDCVMILMLLLVSIIIYYYMNTFITLHQCTF